MIQTPEQELALFQTRTATELSEWTRCLQDAEIRFAHRNAENSFASGDLATTQPA